MSHGYVVGHITVKDADKWAEYRSKVPGTLAPWGAELLLRGRRVASFSGDSPHADVVVIRFPSAAAASDWFASPAYQALIPLREQAADVLLLSYEG
ncbi:DUF1330 domain-containing protein [Thauera sp.]|uniref:DUF1330 domain-containing protein n=1 Tax=Thauera sp. TaxID=1905334 RepID=UPI002626E1C7|nr:DUF1330 domain-containing protein [Thauera sp.]MCK6410581.1 DUF1330 domain-containing protein [Thauera sp.]